MSLFLVRSFICLYPVSRSGVSLYPPANNFVPESSVQINFTLVDVKKTKVVVLQPTKGRGGGERRLPLPCASPPSPHKTNNDVVALSAPPPPLNATAAAVGWLGKRGSSSRRHNMCSVLIRVTRDEEEGVGGMCIVV